MSYQSWRSDIVTVKEAARMLHVSKSTVYRMIRTGILNVSPLQFPGVKGGAWVIPVSELRHYVDALRDAANSRVTENGDAA